MKLYVHISTKFNWLGIENGEEALVNKLQGRELLDLLNDHRPLKKNLI
jgi:hypothetical protein